MSVTLLIIACGVAIVAGVGTAFLRSRSHAWGLVDVPNERSLHSEVTPRGGGIVLVAAVLAGLGVMMLFAGSSGPVTFAAAFAGASLLVTVIGWGDDFQSLPPLLKFVAHAVAAACAVWAWGTFGRVHIPGAGTVSLAPAAALILTLVWIVGLVNAYNFMDGIDGLASGQAVIAGAMWVMACASSVPLVTVIGLLIASGSAGFLWHNRPPARIFLGDAGSGFLGFAFAALPLVAYHASRDPRLPFAGVLIVAPFVFDSAYTLCRRALRGENVVRPHRSHLYQRLVIGGWSHARAALLYLGIAAASGAGAVSWLHGMSPLMMAPALLAILFLPSLVGAVERSSVASREIGKT